MCKDCGCQEGNEEKDFFSQHTHGHGHHAHTREDGTIYYHTHEHTENSPTLPHTHEHEHAHETIKKHKHSHTQDNQKKILSIEKKILNENDEQAEQNRAFLKKHGVTAINFISSPGAGKTTLLERTLAHFENKIKCAVITGDQQTDNDAKRLQGKGAKVVQIETKNACHLNAVQVGNLLPQLIENDTKFLFIENVGNLVCPAAFDLGENFKIALLSVPEGEDKPVKYPVIFSDAAAIILTKIDLAQHVDWDKKKCRNYIRQINPKASIFEISCKTDEGLSQWFAYLEDFS